MLHRLCLGVGMGLDDVLLRRLNAHYDLPLPFNGRISILFDAFKAKTIATTQTIELKAVFMVCINSAEGREGTQTKQAFGWATAISLRDGLEMTYHWIYEQIIARAVGRLFIAGLRVIVVT